MLIISANDFKGFHALSLDSSKRETLESFIDRSETDYLNRLLGPVLSATFIGNLNNGAPASIDLKTIFEPLYYHDEFSKGMKDVMLSLIYSDFISDDQAQHSLAGVVQMNSENSDSKSLQNAVRKGETRWNDAVASWEVIQWYICDNLGKYTGFDGQKLEPKFSAIL